MGGATVLEGENSTILANLQSIGSPQIMIPGKANKFSTQMNIIKCEDIKEEDNSFINQQPIEEEQKQSTYLGQITEGTIPQGTMHFVIHESQEQLSPLLVKTHLYTKSALNFDVTATNDQLPMIQMNGAEGPVRF